MQKLKSLAGAETEAAKAILVTPGGLGTDRLGQTVLEIRAARAAAEPVRPGTPAAVQNRAEDQEPPAAAIRAVRVIPAARRAAGAAVRAVAPAVEEEGSGGAAAVRFFSSYRYVDCLIRGYFYPTRSWPLALRRRRHLCPGCPESADTHSIWPCVRSD